MRTLYLAALIFVSGSLASAQDFGEQPTKEHELLAKTVGQHSGTMKIWTQGPTGPTMDVPFTETNTSVLGGLWIQNELTAGPYQGRGVSGYDANKKKYIGTWMSNMSSHLSVIEGTFDEAKQELTMTFDDINPENGETVKSRTVSVLNEGKMVTMTMYQLNADTKEWGKSFVMTYDRE